MTILTRPLGRLAVAALATGAIATATSGYAAAAKTRVPLPKAFAHKTLISPAVVGYPPYAFLTKHNAISGIDPDLSRALGRPLGKPVHLQVASFENSLLGLRRGTYFMVTGSDITASREKTFDMVSYLADHYEFMTLASRPPLGRKVTALCGLTISTVAADSSIPVLQADSKTCTKQGKKAINVTTFADQGSAVLAVQSGRADATTATVTNLGYVSKQKPGTFRLGGPRYNYVYIGIATKKGDGVARAVARSIDVLIKNGEYHRILAKYGVTADAVKRALVNPNPRVAHA